MKRGDALERELATLHANYRRLGLAVVFKVPTWVQITNHKSGSPIVTGRIEGRVWVDFSGVLKGGRGVAIEAKSMDATRFERNTTAAFQLRRLSAHQRLTLSDVHAVGGIAAVYLMYTGRLARALPGSARYFIPASHIDRLETKSIPWAGIHKFKVPPGKTWIDCVGDWDGYQRDGWANYAEYRDDS